MNLLDVCVQAGFCQIRSQLYISSAMFCYMLVYTRGVPFAQLLGHKQHARNMLFKGYKEILGYRPLRKFEVSKLFNISQLTG